MNRSEGGKGVGGGGERVEGKKKGNGDAGKERSESVEEEVKGWAGR